MIVEKMTVPLSLWKECRQAEDTLKRVRARVEEWAAADLDHMKDPGFVDLKAMEDIAAMLGIPVK